MFLGPTMRRYLLFRQTTFSLAMIFPEILSLLDFLLGVYNYTGIKTYDWLMFTLDYRILHISEHFSGQNFPVKEVVQNLLKSRF